MRRRTSPTRTAPERSAAPPCVIEMMRMAPSSPACSVTPMPHVPLSPASLARPASLVRPAAGPCHSEGSHDASSSTPPPSSSPPPRPLRLAMRQHTSGMHCLFFCVVFGRKYVSSSSLDARTSSDLSGTQLLLLYIVLLFADLSIRLHTFAYVSIRQHTSAYSSSTPPRPLRGSRPHISAYDSLRQHP